MAAIALRPDSVRANPYPVPSDSHRDNPRALAALPSPSVLRIAPPLALARYIDQLCLLRSVAPSRFGREAVGDPRLVRDLKNDRTLRPATRERILIHFAILREGR